MGKKTIIILMSAIMMVGVISGCGSTSVPTSTSTVSQELQSSVMESSFEESSEIESSVETSSKEENTVIHEDIDGFKYADFDTYNSYASENGLGNTKVYINAHVNEIIDISPYGSLIASSDDGGKWLLSIGYTSVFPLENLEETFNDKDIQCFGLYTGYSDITKTPAMMVTKIKYDGKIYNYWSDDLIYKLYFDNADIEKLIEQCDEYTYKQMARNPNDYIGKLVKLKGEVIQVMEEDLNVILRVDITFTPYSYDPNEGYYQDTIYVDYKKTDYNEDRILEDDIVTIYGVSNGNTSYTTVLGAEVTLPSITAFEIDVNE